MHASNMDRSISWGNKGLKLSNAGPVFSKCRFVVVFRKFHNKMECLPMYTNSGRGIVHKADAEQIEWVSVKDVSKKKEWPSTGASQPLFAWLLGDRPVDSNAYLHITESVMVDYADWIEDMGMMERDSFEHLHALRAARNKEARQEPWKHRGRGKSGRGRSLRGRSLRGRSLRGRSSRRGRW
jgi:hypothetical protein